MSSNSEHLARPSARTTETTITAEPTAGRERLRKKRTKRRVVVPISAGRLVRADWEPFPDGDGHPLLRLDHLLMVARSRYISAVLFHAVITLHLMRQEEVSLSELADALGVTTANITSVADNLEHLGLAARKASVMDRRRVIIGLTPLGEAFIRWTGEVLAPNPDPKTP